jgi:hypothetical protein
MVELFIYLIIYLTILKSLSVDYGILWRYCGSETVSKSERIRNLPDLNSNPNYNTDADSDMDSDTDTVLQLCMTCFHYCKTFPT